MITINETRTLIAKVEISTQPTLPFDLNNFLGLFVENGHFSQISEHIFGIFPINSQSKTYRYSVSFKPNNEALIEDLLKHYGAGKKIDVLTHGSIQISFAKPKPPPVTVILWPISHEVTPEILKVLVESNHWGKLERFAFGRHKNFPQFHNAYLHLQINQYNPKNVPDNITINNNTVMVLKPGDANVPRCNFCKTKGHFVTTCPHKNKQRQPRLSSRATPNLTYSDAAKSFDSHFPPLQQHPISNTSTLGKQKIDNNTIQNENSNAKYLHDTPHHLQQVKLFRHLKLI